MELHSPVEELPGVGSIVKKKLEKLEIFTIEDLLYHIPHRYEDYRKIYSVKSAPVGEPLTIRATVKSCANVTSKSGKRMFVTDIEDKTGHIRAVWFSQPYLISIIRKGKDYLFMGKVEWIGKERALISPLFQEIDHGFDIKQLKLVFPIYPETKGLSSKWFRTRLNYLLETHSNFTEEFLPESLLSKLPSMRDSLTAVHNPLDFGDIDKFRLRLAFNELLKLFIINQKRSENWKSHKVTKKINADKNVLGQFQKLLPFKLTPSQNEVVNEIFSDLKLDTPMNRLLEGDVGSGKTAVAAAACYAAFVQGYQSVVMAPTQILAGQHYKTLTEMFNKLSMRISLLSGGETKLAIGKSDIFVGTHALLHRKIKFDDVALVVIDEQHRFGVEQRTHLITSGGSRGKIPHILTMTATPIPRTIAMSLYGDLDLSILREMPKGRIPITTWIVPAAKRKGAYKWIKDKILKEKIQVYIICPLIEDSESETLKEVKSAKTEFENIKKVFPKFKVDLLHGKLSSKDKDKVIQKFKEGETQILVSTAVVEVGIDVANASVIVIEAAERFGLAQLHQLRGRVGRGVTKSYCLLFTQSSSEKTTQRLNLLKTNRSGFDLAEMDLKMRGPGEIFGTNQSGFSRLKVARWSDVEIIKMAKDVSEKIQNDKLLKSKVSKYFFGGKEVLN